MFNETEILKGCRSFDPQAQQQLYKKYVSRMRALCVRYARDREEAKDILQDGFLKIFSQIGQYEATGTLEGWLRRIMVNTAITFYNRNKKHYHESLDELLIEHTKEEGCYIKGPVSEDPELFSEATYTHEELLEALNQLPEGHRIVFNMYHVEDFSHAEIAEALQIEEKTSRSRLFRAKKALQEYLQVIANRTTKISNI